MTLRPFRSDEPAIVRLVPLQVFSLNGNYLAKIFPD